MKRKIFSTLVALVLLLTLGLVTAVPAAAETNTQVQASVEKVVFEETTANPSCGLFSFETRGDGTAEWSTEQVKGGFESYSAKLVIPENKDWLNHAVVKVHYGEALDTITNNDLTFCYYTAAPNTQAILAGQLYIDSGGGSVVDKILMSDCASTHVTEDWTTSADFAAADSWRVVDYDPSTGEMTELDPNLHGTLAEQQSRFPAATLIYAAPVWLGYNHSSEVVAYIDDVTIDGTIHYDLEPALEGTWDLLGTSYSITLVVGASDGYDSVYIDFNRDGDYLDAGEGPYIEGAVITALSQKYEVDRIGQYGSVWYVNFVPRLMAGVSYDIVVRDESDTTPLTAYLDDILVDALTPADEDTDGTAATDWYGVPALPDSYVAALSTITGGRTCLFTATPNYATSPADAAEYVGILIDLNGDGVLDSPGEPELKMEVEASNALQVSSSVTAMTVGVKSTTTITVLYANGNPVFGIPVQLGCDEDGNGILLDPGEVEDSDVTNPSGQVSLTANPLYAGKYIVRVASDMGGTQQYPATPDGIVDYDDQDCTIAVAASPYTVTVTPTTLYKGWTYAEDIKVTVKDAVGQLVKSTAIKYSASGCGITAIVDATATTGATDGTFTIAEEVKPTATGSITLTVKRDVAGTSAPDYSGLTSITVTTAAKFNVDISPTVIAAATGTPLTASFWDVNMKGPGVSNGLLNNVKVTLSGVGVSKTQIINNDDSCTFDAADVTPEQAGTITATFVGTFDPVGGEPAVVITKTLDISVTGYKVVDPVPTTQVIDTTSDISMTVTTKAGAAVNNAKVTIVAEEAAGFEKDVIPGGELESFQAIVIDGSANKITYWATAGPPLTVQVGTAETFLVNDGLYKVTGIKFVKVGVVGVLVKDAGNVDKAYFPTAFSVIPPAVYALSDFVPTKLTAGVDAASLKVKVTEAGVAVTDVATITIDGQPFTGVNLINLGNGVYQVKPALVSEAKTLTVTAKNTGGTKIGSASLEVELPAVIYVITDATEVERDLMLKDVAYTVTVTVTDALGEALAGGKAEIGKYADTTFAALDATTPDEIKANNLELDAEGKAIFEEVKLAAEATLVWKVGEPSASALVLTPAITVEESAYSLDYETPVLAGQSLTVSVLNNYEEPQKYLSVIVRNPDGTTDSFSTGNTGTFTLTPAVAGDYEVYSGSVSTGNIIDTITVIAEAPVTLESITAAPSEVGLSVNETRPLVITATYSDLSEAVVTANITYTSDNTTVATVSEAGLITAQAEGTATITVSYTEDEITKTDDVSVTVSEVADILAYYRGYSGDPNVVETDDLLKAADDWSADVTPPGFTNPISTDQLLQLADEWTQS